MSLSKQPLVDAYNLLKTFEPSVPVFHYEGRKEVKSGNKVNYIVFNEKLQTRYADNRNHVTNFSIEIKFVSNELTEFKYIDLINYLTSNSKNLYDVDLSHDASENTLIFEATFNV